MNAATARKRDPEATCNGILCAARELFAAKGYAATSTAAIARTAGVTKSLIHHHFGGKEQLWIRAIDSQFVEEEALLAAALEQGTHSVELMATSMERLFGMYRERPELTRLMAWQYLDETSVDECPNRALHIAVDLFRIGQEQGLVRDDIEAANAVLMFIGLIEYFFQARATKGPLMGCDLITPEAEQSYLRDATRVFLQGMQPTTA